jgi:hypothetical protein
MKDRTPVWFDAPEIDAMQAPIVVDEDNRQSVRDH